MDPNYIDLCLFSLCTMDDCFDGFSVHDLFIAHIHSFKFCKKRGEINAITWIKLTFSNNNFHWMCYLHQINLNAIWLAFILFLSRTKKENHAQKVYCVQKNGEYFFLICTQRKRKKELEIVEMMRGEQWNSIHSVIIANWIAHNLNCLKSIRKHSSNFSLWLAVIIKNDVGMLLRVGIDCYLINGVNCQCTKILHLRSDWFMHFYYSALHFTRPAHSE